MTMTSQFVNMTSSSIYLTLFCFYCQFYLLVQVSCQYHHWFWSYDNFFLYKGLNRNPKIGNTHIWVLPNIPNIWRLGKIRIPNFARIDLMNCYWMLQNARVAAFTVSDLLRENQQGGGGGGKITTPPTQIRLKGLSQTWEWIFKTSMFQDFKRKHFLGITLHVKKILKKFSIYFYLRCFLLK